MNISLSFVRTSVRHEESEEYSVEAGDELTCHIAMLLETLVSARACLTNCAVGTVSMANYKKDTNGCQFTITSMKGSR
jgi:cyclophilin family peptidyl-prolyl cis-trans isomerase